MGPRACFPRPIEPSSIIRTLKIFGLAVAARRGTFLACGRFVRRCAGHADRASGVADNSHGVRHLREQPTIIRG